MPRTFNLILNSQNTSNVDTTGGLGAYSYYINWNSILPSTIKKFNVNYVFRSVQSDTLRTELVLLGVGLGSQLNYSQSSNQTSIINAINPNSYVGTTTQYNYISSGDPGFCCNYPSTANVVVNLQLASDQTTTNIVGHYCLVLQFTEIIE